MKTIINNLTLFLVFLLLLVLSLKASGKDLKIPDLGSSNSSIFSKKEEFLIGQSWLHRNYYNQGRLEQDFVVLEYLENITKRIQGSNNIDTKVTTLLFENRNFNAFAVPGNIIGINTGVIVSSKTESALSSVIAHELAHLSLQHISGRVGVAQGQSKIALLGGLMALALLLGGESQAAIPSLLVSQGVAQANILKYSRSQELEADHKGFNYMVAAGYNPFGMAAVHKTLSSLKPRGGREVPAYLLTHPTSQQRLKETNLRLLTFDESNFNEDNFAGNNFAGDNFAGDNFAGDNYFEYIKINSRFHHHHPFDLEKIYAKEVGFEPDNSKYIYGYAKALLERKKPELAAKYIQKLVKQDPLNNAFVYLYLKLLSLQKSYKKAEAEYKRWNKIRAKSYAIDMVYAEVLTLKKDYAGAIQILKDLTKKRPTDVVVWHQLAEISGLAGQNI